MNAREQAERELREELFRDEVEAIKAELRERSGRWDRVKNFFALQRAAWASLIEGEN